MSRVCLRAILDFIYENFIIRVARVDDKKLQFVKADVVEADRSRFYNILRYNLFRPAALN